MVISYHIEKPMIDTNTHTDTGNDKTQKAETGVSNKMALKSDIIIIFLNFKYFEDGGISMKHFYHESNWL